VLGAAAQAVKALDQKENAVATAQGAYRGAEAKDAQAKAALKSAAGLVDAAETRKKVLEGKVAETAKVAADVRSLSPLAPSVRSTILSGMHVCVRRQRRAA
jgi:hypothetical protein